MLDMCDVYLCKCDFQNEYLPYSAIISFSPPMREELGT